VVGDGVGRRDPFYRRKPDEADIGYAVAQVWKVKSDPCRRDDWDGPGNGWRCASY
jgi:hypothetical protein